MNRRRLLSTWATFLTVVVLAMVMACPLWVGLLVGSGFAVGVWTLWCSRESQLRIGLVGTGLIVGYEIGVGRSAAFWLLLTMAGIVAAFVVCFVNSRRGKGKTG